MTDYDKNHGSAVTVVGTAIGDTFTNHGDRAIISGLGGNDNIRNYGSYVSINGGSGDDTVDADSVLDENVTVQGGAGQDKLFVGKSWGNDAIKNATSADTVQFYRYNHATKSW